MRKRKEDEGD